MREEFILENNYDENVIKEESPELILSSSASKHIEFTKRLERDLLFAKDDYQVVRTVVMAALDIEGLVMDDPGIIVESILVTPEKRAHVLAMAERIMRQNIQ